jgi:hypothetical protein
VSQRIINVCDVCGAEQQQANHWFSIVVTRLDGKGVMLTLAALGSLFEPHENDVLFDLCGETCALKKVSEFLGMR